MAVFVLASCGGPFEPHEASVESETPHTRATFHGAMALAFLQRHRDSAPLDTAFALNAWGTPEALSLASHILSVHDPDAGHPLRRLIDPNHPIPEGRSTSWTVPSDGRKVHVHRVLVEAVDCDRSGWRPQTETWVCGPMRDGGGYGSTHAAWALLLARSRGCTPAACLGAITDELMAAAQGASPPATTLDVDLQAERILFAALAGRSVPDAWRQSVAKWQGDDGGIAVSAADPLEHRIHATAVALWAEAVLKNGPPTPSPPNSSGTRGPEPARGGSPSPPPPPG